MPSLAQLTDAYEQPDTFPVEPLYAPNKEDAITIRSIADDPIEAPVANTRPEPRPEPGLLDNFGMAGVTDKTGASESKLIKKLFGLGGEERYQLWPEKIVREGLSAAHDISRTDPTASLGLRREDVTDIPPPDMPTKDSTWLGQALGVPPVAAQPNDYVIEAAQAMSALAGTGGLAGTTDATLGSAPFLRPALKYKEKLYKGKEGQQHQDVIPEALYPEFQRMAMSGEDISHYNFGFVNDKGHFLDREAALKYGIDTGLIDPHAGKFGALTSTLMADSSKPGAAIEAMAKTNQSKFDFSVGESSGSRSVKLGPTEITYGVNPKNNDVELSLIKTDKNKRGEGNARAAVEQFLSEADANNKRVLLNADPMDKSTSKPKLEEFYKSLGFVRNKGNKRDFTTRAEYIREPVLKSDNDAATAIQSIKPTFYSAVEHQINNISQSKMTGEQWLGTLSNKPGVKPEELQWTGLQDFLLENKGKPVTKEQVQEHIAANKIELQDVHKGELKFDKSSKYALPEVIKAAKEAGDNRLELVLANDGNAYRALTKKFPELSGDEDWASKVSTSVFGGDTMPKGTTKYEKWQLPGGSNYREMLLTLPEKKFSDVNQMQEFKLATKNINTLEDVALARKFDVHFKETFKGISDEDVFKLAQKAKKEPEYQPPYTTSHWDEPNILAHVRMNDRTIEGKKSLHLEEIQSDWHQQGRDKGYSNLQEYQAKQDNLKKQIDDVVTERARLAGSNASFDRAKYQAAHEKEMSLIDEYNQLHDRQAYCVPDAPFKKTWHELALKRMIREAAEKGYDRLSWTPGEAQAARYDLSKQVDQLLLDPKKDGSFTLVGRKNNGNVIEQNVTAEKLPDIIGKEAAKKLLDAEKNKYGMHELTGQQLKIGGEGMKGFYDQIIPKALEKLGKEHGVKVKQTVDPNAGEKFAYLNKKSGNKGQIFNSQEEAKAWLKESGINPDSVTLLQVNRYAKEGKKFEPIHYIDIPQSLKDTAMHKGFPLFSGGYMYTPVAGNPFEEKKK